MEKQDILKKVNHTLLNQTAKWEDIKLFKENLKRSKLKIKAAGEVKSFEDAEEFIKLGADRLGTSRLIKLI